LDVPFLVLFGIVARLAADGYLRAAQVFEVPMASLAATIDEAGVY
jgi:hypothetical protein